MDKRNEGKNNVVQDKNYNPQIGGAAFYMNKKISKSYLYHYIEE